VARRVAPLPAVAVAAHLHEGEALLADPTPDPVVL
jgi:hypothetical protein